jgi:acetyl esterase/lipase
MSRSPLLRTLRPLCLSATLAVGVLGWAQTGTLVSAELISTFAAADIATSAQAAANGTPLPEAQVDVEGYLVEYTSIDRNGEDVIITAQLFLPAEVLEPMRFVFGPGTTGLVDRCAPSRELTDGVVFSNYLTYGSAMASLGIPTLLPDYLGLGDPERIQPYMSSRDEAHVMLDGARALEQFLAERRPETPAGPVFFGGYSRGGHASLAGADLWAEYAPDVELAGVIGYGSSADLEALLRDWQVAAPYIIFVMSRLYPEIDPAEILVPDFADNLFAKVTENCVDGIQRNFPREPEALFQPDFIEALYGEGLAEAFPALHAALEENKPGLAGHGVPVKLAQGENDTVVRLRSQNRYVDELCATGATVYYPVYEGVLHDTRWVAMESTLTWMRARAAGETPPNDCPAR